MFALALAFLLATGTSTSVAQPSSSGPPIPEPARATVQHALSAIAGQQFARAALVDHRLIADLGGGPADSKALALMLRDASSLDPSNRPLMRLALDAAAAAADTDSVAVIARSLLTSDPTDTDAQLSLINARLDALQSAEERLALLEGFLGPRGESLDPTVRSRLAVMAAILCRERADAKGFARHLTTATTLDSSNRAAATLALEYGAARLARQATTGQTETATFELLVNTLIAAPLDPTIHNAIASELAVAGATEQALRFYDNAVALTRRLGPAQSEGENAERAARQAERLVQVWKLQGPETVVKQLNDAVDEPRREMKVALDVASATGKDINTMPKPLDYRLPIALERVRLVAAFASGGNGGDRSSIDRSLSDFAASLSDPNLDSALRSRLRTELAYLNAMLGTGDLAIEIAAVMQEGSAAPAGSVERMRAWQKAKAGDTDAARADLEAMGNDPLALLALAVLDDRAWPSNDTGSRAASDRLVRLANANGASPISAWAASTYRRRNADAQPPLSPVAQRWAAMGAGIPSWIDDIARDPQKLVMVRVESASGTSGLGALQPTILNVRISNNTPAYLAVGPGETVDDQMLIRSYVDIGGMRNDEFSRTETFSLGGRLRLAPRQEAVFTLWADPGLGGWAVQNALTKSARLRFTIMQGYIVDNSGPRPGPFGAVVDTPPIQRGSIQPSDPARLSADLATLQDEEFAVALLQARLQLQSTERPLSPEQANTLVGAIFERYRRATSAERIAMLTLTPTTTMVPAASEFDRVASSIDEPDPRVMRAAIISRVASPSSPFMEKYSQSRDEGVKLVHATMKARLESGGQSFAMMQPINPRK